MWYFPYRQKHCWHSDLFSHWVIRCKRFYASKYTCIDIILCKTLVLAIFPPLAVFLSITFLKNTIYLWLCWIFAAVRRLSLAVRPGATLLRRTGFSSRWLLLWGTGSRRAGSVVAAHGPSCSVACGVFPGQESNLCPLHWQVDSLPLNLQGSPRKSFSFPVTQPAECLLLAWTQTWPIRAFCSPATTIHPGLGMWPTSFQWARFCARPSDGVTGPVRSRLPPGGWPYPWHSHPVCPLRLSSASFHPQSPADLVNSPTWAPCRQESKKLNSHSPYTLDITFQIS